MGYQVRVLFVLVGGECRFLEKLVISFAIVSKALQRYIVQSEYIVTLHIIENLRLFTFTVFQTRQCQLFYDPVQYYVNMYSILIQYLK